MGIRDRHRRRRARLAKTDPSDPHESTVVRQLRSITGRARTGSTSIVLRALLHPDPEYCYLTVIELVAAVRHADRGIRAALDQHVPVSYTHLTLPTSDLV